MKTLIFIILLIFAFNSIASDNSGSHLGGVKGGGDESDRVKYDSGRGYEVKEETLSKKKESKDKVDSKEKDNFSK